MLVLTHVASVGNSVVCLQEVSNSTAGGVGTEAGSRDFISHNSQKLIGGEWVNKRDPYINRVLFSLDQAGNYGAWELAWGKSICHVSLTT